MGFWRNVSPSGAVGDFANQWSGNPYRWRVLAVSVAATTGFMILAIPESERIEPQQPKVTYITSFAEGRSDAEILASNIANQQRKEERLAELERREERRKEIYRQLGRATGLDVDAMERQLEEEAAAEASATQAATTEAQALPVDGG